MKKLLLISLLGLSAITYPDQATPSLNNQETLNTTQYVVNEPIDAVDYARIRDIFAQNYEHIVIGEDNIDASFKTYILDSNAILKVIRNAQNTIVGFVTFKRAYSAPGLIHIEIVAIDKQYQKTGYGSQLLSYVNRYAKAHGFNQIELLAQSCTSDFYGKNGYKKVNEFGFYLNKTQTLLPINVLVRTIL